MSALMSRLKKTRGQGTSALKAKLEQQGQGGYQRDARIWKHTWAENDQGIPMSFNKIRFLPVPLVDMEKKDNGELPEDAILTPCALVIKHQFSAAGGFYGENSLQTFGEDCPVRDHDRPLWKQQKDTNDKALKEILLDRLPSNKYYANILVIEDAQKPENNGKVFLMEFGNAVKKIIDAAANPLFPTDPKIEDVFCAFEGAVLDYNLVGRKSKFKDRDCIVPEYDKSKVIWNHSTPLAESEEEIEAIWKQTHSLQDFLDRKNFKTYEELEQRLKKVMGIPADAPLVPMGSDTSVSAAPQRPQEQKPVSASELAGKEDSKPEPNKSSTDDNGVGSMDDFERMLAEAE